MTQEQEAECEHAEIGELARIYNLTPPQVQALTEIHPALRKYVIRAFIHENRRRK